MECKFLKSVILAGVCIAQAALAGPTAIRIAVINDQAGPFSAHGGQGTVIAAKLAAEDVGGAVLGKPIEVVFSDHQNKPDVASALASRYADVEKVDVFADGSSSAATLAIQSVARTKKKIFLITGGASSDLTGKDCSPTGFHLVPDTYSFAKSVGTAAFRNGARTWFFVTADYAFGAALEADARSVIEPMGAKVLGTVKHPPNAQDFTQYLLQAKSSGASAVALASAGADLTAALKQAQEFQIASKTTKVVAFLLDTPDLQALGLENAGQVQFVLPFYWDLNDETRAWSNRFKAASGGKLPTRIHAMTYAGVLHYLRAVKAAGTDDGPTVAAAMRKMPMNDMINKNVKIRGDGRVMTDMYLFQAKSKAESSGPGDLMKLISRLPAEDAFRPLAQSECKNIQN